VIQDSGTYKALLLKLAFEARSIFGWDIDQAELKFLPDAATIADRTIGFADIKGAAEGMPDFEIQRVQVEEIINTIDLQWARRAAESGSTAYGSVLHRREEASIGRFKELARPELFQFDFVTSEAMASDSADFYLARFSSPARRRAVCRTVLPFADLEGDDVVAFNLINPAGPSGAFPINLTAGLPNQADAFDGLDGGQFFEVESITKRTSDFTLEIVGREL
jgi:hypothetical protein